MRHFILVSVIQAIAIGINGVHASERQERSLVDDVKSTISVAAEVINTGITKLPEVEMAIFPDCVTPEPVCPNKNVTFWYYTRSKPDQPVKLTVGDEESFSQLEKNDHPWKIIIHGYTKSKDDIPNPQLRSAYFRHGDYNLISVDYEPLARDKCYIQAVHNAPLIADCIAQMIDALIEKGFFKPEDLHVIGFSLGGQIAGDLYKSIKNQKPGRVTGLDPASPLFDGNINERLTKEAGQFVDVIHTNTMFKGEPTPSGHVDFYVNGGLNQPGCLLHHKGSYSTCSHDRSPLYFAESINAPEGFWGIPCNHSISFYTGQCNTDESQLALMGEYVSQETRGIYYLQTASKPPFALGKVTEVSLV